MATATITVQGRVRGKRTFDTVARARRFLPWWAWLGGVTWAMRRLRVECSTDGGRTWIRTDWQPQIHMNLEVH